MKFKKAYLTLYIGLSLMLLFKNIVVAQETDYYTTVTFPANYAIGDYVEFLKVLPINASSSGYYEISISYTRIDIAAAATHLASVSHANPSVWREVGRINSNGYASNLLHNFTIDCNTQSANARFRIRAIGTYGTETLPLTVYIKVHSINRNTSWTALNVTGNDPNVDKLLPMTDEWSLYTGKLFSSGGAAIAIKAIANGNVGIGTATPSEKLSVNGNIRAKEIKVETANWPDYVFEEDYQMPSLTETEAFIKQHRHLPGMPSAEQVNKDGINLGEMNRKLLEKVEELTLIVIEQQKELKILKEKIQ